MALPSIPDYCVSIKTPQLIHPAILSGGHPIEKGMNLIKYSGGFCVVFPYQTAQKKYAVRCWHAEIADAKKRTQLIAEALKQSSLPYFVGFEYFEDGIMAPQGKQPLVLMDWVEADPLKKYIIKHLNAPKVLKDLAENFKKMVNDLHESHFSHGDLQHGNIMVKNDGSLVLVDYDSMYVPALNGMKDEIKGLAGYQHLSRWDNEYLSEKADYFSELVIYMSIHALAIEPTLWNDLKMEDTDTMLFSEEDIKSQGTSPIFSRLRKISNLAPMVDKLCDYMKCRTIDELQPLESTLVSQVDSIAAKWSKGNGYVPTKHEPEIDSADKIAAKWKNGNGYTPKSLDDIASEIASKWKKQG